MGGGATGARTQQLTLMSGSVSLNRRRCSDWSANEWTLTHFMAKRTRMEVITADMVSPARDKMRVTMAAHMILNL